MASRLLQLKLLLWKNFVLQKRKICVSLFEVLLPVGFAVLIMWLRTVVETREYPDPKIFQEFAVDSRRSYLHDNVLYFPNTSPAVVNLMAKVQKKIATPVIGYSNESEIQDFYSANSSATWAAITFDVESGSSTLPKALSYSIHCRSVMDTGYQSTDGSWKTKKVFPEFQDFGPRASYTDMDGIPEYHDHGFLWLQYSVDSAIIETLNGTVNLTSDLELKMRKVPYPKYYTDPLTLVLQHFFPFLLMLSLLLNAIQTTKNIVWEKERKLKETMKMMGMSGWIYWLSWFLKMFVYLLLAMIIYTILFAITINEVNGAVLKKSNASVFFVFMLCYSIATICLCFMVSTFFKAANTGAAGGGIVFFLSYVPYFFFNDEVYAATSLSGKLGVCLFSNVAMAFGAKVIATSEAAGGGLKWSNFASPPRPDDDFSMLLSMIMLLVDSALYLIVTWYVDAVKPGDFGVPLPYYFPFTKWYWCGGSGRNDKTQVGEREKDKKYFEDEPIDEKVGIQINNLRKKFGKKVAVAGTSLSIYEGQISVLLGHNGAGKTTTMSMITGPIHWVCFLQPSSASSGVQPDHRLTFEAMKVGNCSLRVKVCNKFGKKVAVAGTSLSIYEGQISVLLGHNGAGKTTTMSMITGFIPPTSGTATVSGLDIRTDLDEVRKNLGVCPQHNILFDNLSVMEHLEFFGELKGTPKSTLKAEVDNLLNKLGLLQKARDAAGNLSGGQKRKLSVGIALIGGSKIVILDEPTSGMDPLARRQMWDILQREKADRTILLTTHFMDEADILGDRISIMAEGVIKCSGTSHFLKKLYGAGYHLVLAKTKLCDPCTLTEAIQKVVPGAEHEDIGRQAEIQFLLPFDETNMFPKLFNYLDSAKEDLGITSFGISATTLEEVFIKVGENIEDEENGDVHAKLLKSASDPNLAAENENLLCPPKAKLRSSHESIAMNENASLYLGFNENIEKNVGMTLHLQRFRGMFVKKAIHTWRNRVVTLVQLLLPVIFTILALVVEKVTPKAGDEPPLLLDLAPFKGTIVPYSSGVTPSTLSTDLANQYADLFKGTENSAQKIDRSTYPNVTSYYLDAAESHGTFSLNREYMIGGMFDGKTNKVVGYFNGQAYHTPAISLTFIMNSLLKYYVSTDHSIITYNAPFPRIIKEVGQSPINYFMGIGLSIVINMLIGMAFLAASFVIFSIKDRNCGAKHLQVVSGVGPLSYWLSSFAWDLCNFLLPIIALVIVFVAFQVAAYSSGAQIGIVLVVLLLYAWSVIPFTFLFHFIFRTPAAGMTLLTMLHLIGGTISVFAVYILRIPSLDLLNTGNIVDWVMGALSPTHCFGMSFIYIYTNYNNREYCSSLPFAFRIHCASKADYNMFRFYDNFFEMQIPGIGRYVLIMCLQGVVFFLFTLAIEYGVLTLLIYKLQRKVIPPSQPQIIMDSDVQNEKNKVNNTPLDQLLQSHPIVIKNLTKVFGNVVAVNETCLTIPSDECFGLLGQNGAGKTTTFKMLTGDERVTSGDAFVLSKSIKTHIKEVQQNLGYCPQFDGLIDQMTGRETLRMYARLRGVQESQIDRILKELMAVLLITRHADKLTSAFSGGNKRKLSTAMALIGDPPFILLDEPTTGMDPVARRQLWNVLSHVRLSGRTLVLTSHSMEECDALCTNIAIMVNGKFVCLGSPQHLKSKFAQGYTITIQLKTMDDGSFRDTNPVIEFMKAQFPQGNIQVFDDKQGYIHLQLLGSTMLADLFSTLENMKDTHCVSDYSVHQTTLEQIFLSFTKNQYIVPEKRNGGVCRCFTCC